jgi:hypothetical protein
MKEEINQVELKRVFGAYKKYHHFLRENFKSPSHLKNSSVLYEMITDGNKLFDELERRIEKLIELGENAPSADAEVELLEEKNELIHNPLIPLYPTEDGKFHFIGTAIEYDKPNRNHMIYKKSKKNVSRRIQTLSAFELAGDNY